LQNNKRSLEGEKRDRLLPIKGELKKTENKTAFVAIDITSMALFIIINLLSFVYSCGKIGGFSICLNWWYSDDRSGYDEFKTSWGGS
jgi:hypothetical protein